MTASPRPALVLFGHGSLLCGSDEPMRTHADRLREKEEWLDVQVGFLNYSEPAIEKAVEQCIARGAGHIVIAPYFLVAGKFVTVDLPARIASVKAAYPGVQFTVAQALEDVDGLLDVVDSLMQSPQPLDAWQAAAIQAVKQHCTLRVDCPLYGSSACRATA